MDFTPVVDAIKVTGFLLSILAAFMIINIILGTYHNIDKLKEKFSAKKLLSGVIRAATVCVSTLGISALFALLPIMSQVLKLGEVADAFMKDISIAIICVTIAKTVGAYIVKCTTQITNIYQEIQNK